MTKVRVIDKSKAVLREIDRNINDLLVVSGDVVSNEAKQNTPVDSGSLKSSITNEVEGSEAKIGSNLAYAARIELGFVGKDILGRTFNQQGYYMLTNALRNNKSKIIKLFARKLLGL